MSLGRRRAPVVIDLPGLTRAQLPERVEAHGASRELWVRLGPDGGLRARVPGGLYHSPPLLRAQVSALPSGVRIEGEARESLIRPFTLLVLVGPALLLAAVAVDGVRDDDPTGVLVGGIGAAVLLAIAALQVWLRPRVFRSDLNELHQRLPQALGAPRT